MNIIEAVKDIVLSFPNISDLHIDYTDGEEENYGIYPTGDQKISESVTGKQKRQHNFVLYAVYQSVNDYDRLANSTFLLDLAYYLEEAANDQPIEVTINGKIRTGRLTDMSSANGMLYGYQNGTLTGPVTYQLQISAKYEVESEDM